MASIVSHKQTATLNLGIISKQCYKIFYYDSTVWTIKICFPPQLAAATVRRRHMYYTGQKWPKTDNVHNARHIHNST